jgi:hypothetical protein
MKTTIFRLLETCWMWLLLGLLAMLASGCGPL